MKKIHLIFIGFLSVEILIIALTLLLFRDNCGSACDPHSIFNPFGIVEKTNHFKSCIELCVRRPHVFFYITFDIFLLTVISYIGTLIIDKKFTSDNNA